MAINEYGSYGTSANYLYNPSTGQYDNVTPPGSFVSYTTPPPPVAQVDLLGRNAVNTSVKTVRVKAGFLGQVVAKDPRTYDETIVWESSPKKTLAKADRAAVKAQLRAVERSFE
jgi:hypothetical protein